MVVLDKGDKPSQWETPIFRHPIFMKFVTSDYVMDPTTQTNLRFQGSNGSMFPQW